MDGTIFQESVDPEGTAQASNTVTGVVFDFRGFDTLGEATVLFAAVSGVLLALRAAIPKKKGGEKE
jgi:multisubunit Na+/H+ antiporter MnhB subunit